MTGAVVVFTGATVGFEVEIEEGPLVLVGVEEVVEEAVGFTRTVGLRFVPENSDLGTVS